MIIELFGLPGSGKSFCCEQVEKKMNYKDVLKFYKEHFIGKVVFHVFIKLFWFDTELKKLYKDMIEILGEQVNNNNIIDKNVNIKKYLQYLLFVYFVEKKYYKRNIIIDEGIIHYLIVLNAEYSVDFNTIKNIKRLYEDKLNKYVILGIKCDLSVASEQMKKRNRKRAAIDFLNNKELEFVLEQYKNGIDYFGKYFECIALKEINEYIEEKCKEINSDKI